MRNKLIVVLGFLFILLTFSLVSAGGHSSDQLSQAGWACMPAGPNLWIHCFAPGAGSPKTVQVKVFGVSGDPFLGTELLIHQDIYTGQPCPQDELATYEPVAGTPYMACHHFETGHH